MEDRSGSISLEFILEKILGPNGVDHSWAMHPFRGIGPPSQGSAQSTQPDKPASSEQFADVAESLWAKSSESVGGHCCSGLGREGLPKVQAGLAQRAAHACNPRPNTLFRIAIEEMEAWLLGDRPALKSAYPNADDVVMNDDVQDSVCGTWEVLADAVHSGGPIQLKSSGYPAAGVAKCEWAGRIAPLMDVDSNQSKSFQVFRDGVRKLAGI